MSVQNRTIFEGDNLPVLRGMETASVDLIYLDPPFNSNRTYETPIGSEVAGATFRDPWSLDNLDQKWHNDIADQNLTLYRAIEVSEHTHSASMKAYLIMIAVRIIEMKRILKPTGSIYLHCDPTVSHYLKMIMDGIFGVENFKNEIVWHYTGGGRSKTSFSRKHDIIFFYTRSKSDHCFNVDSIRVPYKETSGYAKSGIISKVGKRYLPNPKGTPVGDVWDISIINSKERLGYPTQKPLVLLERIVAASSNQGDLVLDPFCGCATTCVAAENLGRHWIGIDISPKAVELVRERLKERVGMFGPIIHRTDVPTKDIGISLATDREEIVNQLYAAQGAKCPGCFETFKRRNLTIDHIIPRSKGGSNKPENLQLLCQACNLTKNNGTMEDMARRNLRDNTISEEQYRLILNSIGSKLDPIRESRIFVNHFENLVKEGFPNTSHEGLQDLLRKFKESEKIIKDAE